MLCQEGRKEWGWSKWGPPEKDGCRGPFVRRQIARLKLAPMLSRKFGAQLRHCVADLVIGFDGMAHSLHLQ